MTSTPPGSAAGTGTPAAEVEIDVALVRALIAAQHPDVVARMETAYDQWWAEILPLLENENAVPPALAPYKKLYFDQYGGGPGIMPGAPVRPK